MRLDEYSHLRKWSVRGAIYAMLIGTIFLFSWLGTNVLENKYLKKPPHIECADLMNGDVDDQHMIKYEFELFK
jgi:hypothetical protein